MRIISTAYSQLWELVGEHIGVPMTDIACTNLDLAGIRERFGEELDIRTKFNEEKLLSLDELRQAAEDQVSSGRDVVEVFDSPEFAPLTRTLNGFYWGDLPRMG